MHAVSLVLAFALAFALASCAAAVPEEGAEDNAAPLHWDCAFDDDIVFDPHGGLVLQAANDVACVRIERAPLADVRRGVEWRALRVTAVVDDVVLVNVNANANANVEDGDDATYENSHHNCRDVVTATGGAITVAIDGVSENPDVCFQDDADAWRLVLTVNDNDGVRSETLTPH